MSDDLRTLESRLLRQPFDHQLRVRYAEALQQSGEFAAALEQWRLVADNTDCAAAEVGAAICCAHLDDRAAAEEHRRRAQEAGSAPAELPPMASRPAPALRAVAPVAAVGDAAKVLSIQTSKTVRFADVAGMEELKKTMRLRIVEPFRSPGLFQRFKRRAGGGVMLYGPPGCGKTLIARALANECEANFTTVGISEVLNLWLGESERNLAAVFDRARAESPSVLFFDEIDALAFSRSKASSDTTRTLVNEFLDQLDGAAARNDSVLILAATNRPWDVDDAMKRPGRFDRQIFVPPPDFAAREQMFRDKLLGVPTAGLDLAALAAKTEGLSGADLDGVVELAKDHVLDAILTGDDERPLGQSDLLLGIEQQIPSTEEWLKTARNLVKFGGVGRTYRDLERYLRDHKLY